jgi:putative endonuclease
MTNRFIGQSGEKIAQEYLVKKGYKILETNKRFSRFCEIDIIALDKKTLVFCEVKTRSSNLYGSPLEAITPNKYENIKKGAYLYLQERDDYKNFRIDAISIILHPKLEIQHLKNI